LLCFSASAAGSLRKNCFVEHLENSQSKLQVLKNASDIRIQLFIHAAREKEKRGS
jgi:hypothetical protein